jgi:hypothetical protein
MSTFRHLDPEARIAKGSPDPSAVYVQRELTDMSVGFMMKPETLVANQICPSVPVKQQGGKYIHYPRGYFFRDDMKKRADGAESAGSGFDVDSTPTYFADVWAWHTDIGPQVRANAQIVDVDRAATMLCTNKAMLRREKLWLANFFATSVWTTEVTGATSGGGGVAGTDLGWLDANAKPVQQIKKVIRAVQKLHGFKPNHAVFDTLAWDTFCEHPNVLARINNGQTPGGPAEITKQMVASWLGLDKVLVLEGVITTSKEGATDALDFMATSGSGQLLLAYAPPAPGQFIPSAYYFFDWVADGLVGSYGNAVSRWYNQDRKATRYEIEMATQCKLVSADMGGFMTNMVV